MPSYRIRLMAIAVMVGGLFSTGGPLQAKASAFMIITPSPGEVILGKRVKVIVGLSDEQGLPQNGEVLLWLDAIGERTRENARVLSAGNEYLYEPVQSGLHTLIAQLIPADFAHPSAPIETQVEFETITEELRPVPTTEGPVEAPPEEPGGFFLRNGGNTALTLAVVAFTIALLWYGFDKKLRKL